MVLLFILYTSGLFHIVGKHIVGHADETTSYVVISKQLSRLLLVKSLNQDFIATISGV